MAARFGRHGMPRPASNPDVRSFDLETGLRVTSKVGNLPSKYEHSRPLGCRIIRYVRDQRTNGRTDGRTKSTLNAPFPTVGGIINEHDDDDDDLCNSQHCSYIIIALDYARAACSPVCLSHVGVDSKLMTVGSCGLHYSIPF